MRLKTFKLLFDGENLGKIPCIEIRNHLAHNIREASIKDDKIVYMDKRSTEKQTEI